MGTKKINLFIILIFTLSFNIKSNSDVIDISGAWAPELDATNLSSGAGSNLPSSISSSSTAFVIDLDPGSYSHWYVYAGRQTSGWNTNLDLRIKRTSNGGNATITGGTEYVSLEHSWSFLFEGEEKTDNIYCQLEISNISVAIAPDNYDTWVYVLIMDR